MKIPSSLVACGTAVCTAAIFTSCKPAAVPSATPSPSATPAASAALTVTSDNPAAAAALAAALAAAASTSPSATPSGPELKDPVATVNGIAISKADLIEAFNNAVKAAGVNPADLTADQKLDAYRQILDEMITEKIINKDAVGVTVPDADVTAEIAKLRSQYPSLEDFKKQLEQFGQTEATLAAEIKKSLQQQRWIESQIASKVTVTDEEARKFYSENKQEFEEPATVRASHILFRTSKDDTETVVAEKKAAAAKAAKAAKKGGDFAALAKELSEEPGAKESGGDLGFFPKDRMVPEFAEAAFSMKKGTVSDPIRTQFGWHVIRVVDSKPARTVPYDEVKQQVITYLKTSQQRKALAELIKSLRAAATIDNTLPPAPPAASIMPGGMEPTSTTTPPTAAPAGN